MVASMNTNWRAMLIALSVFVAVAKAAIVPFDFTGHWSGPIKQQGATGFAFADLSGTGTPITGTVGANLGGIFYSCAISDGQQKHKVILPVTCSDGSSGKLKAKLDPTMRTLKGAYKTHRPGHKGHHGTFTLTNAGSCVPTGQDCSDPSTGGGEASVCCNGDCTLDPTTGGHACN